MQAESNRGQGAVVGGWTCLVLGALILAWSAWAFLLYVPLFVATFVLGIVSIAQKRLGNGIPMLLLSIVAPVFICFASIVFAVAKPANNQSELNANSSKVEAQIREAETELEKAQRSAEEAEKAYEKSKTILNSK